MVLALAHPFAEGVAKVSDHWADDPAAVLVWRAPEMVFGVFFPAPGTQGGEVARRVLRVEGAHEVASWEVPAHPASLPVYFDYEGVWAHAVHGTTTRYPRALGDGTVAGPAALSPGLRRKLAELLARPFRPTGDGETVRRFGPAGFPRSWRQMVARGYADWRTFPDLGKVPPLPSARLGRVALIQGTLREKADPVALFQDLVGSARVFPFLYAVEDRRLLVGALGRSEASQVEGRSRPVLPTLEEHLEGIRVTSSAVENMVAQVDHRYDRLFPVP